MKLRILCLHGKEQSAEIMRTRLGRLPHWSREVATYEFLDAPHLLPLKDGNDVPGRYWFSRTPAGTWDQASLDTSLHVLKETLETRGPFHGLLGFSQGGTFATIALSQGMPRLLQDLSFVVLFGAPELSQFPRREISSTIRSIHFGGKADLVVPVDSSRALASRYYNPVFHEHEQGHCIPMKRPMMNLVIDFITEERNHFIQSVPSRIEGPQTISADTNPIPTGDVLKAKVEDIRSSDSPVECICASDTAAEMQRSEIEVLQSIFPSEDITVLRPGPATAGQPTGCLQVVVASATSSLAASWPWAAGLTIKFEMPELYPEAVNNPLKIQLITGQLSLLDFTISMRKSLMAKLNYCAADGGDVFACVEAAKTWVDNSEWLAAGAVACEISNSEYEREAGVPSTPAVGSSVASVSIEDQCKLLSVFMEESDVQMQYMINQATKEAEIIAARCASSRSRVSLTADASEFNDIFDDINDEVEQDVLGASRGIWPYTIGLVGKPSAGKSSFYNAATHAAYSKDGRRMAAVAAHPFTTIEPNIGPGFYPGPQDNDSGNKRAALYGRDERGRRLLPVKIKDVAGLVPGAYQGRGKGNQFLADLCEADVLVHVVDATGKSDKDGNIIVVQASDSEDADASSSHNLHPANIVVADKKEGSSSPSEDCKWVREELHRWIHGNVKAKWNSVNRKAKDKHIDRVVALFSGYQGTKAFTYRALQRARIKLSELGIISAMDLHRLVAHFLSIRFPTVLALNKIDDFDSKEEGLKVIATCQEEALRRGELAVPVCARAENWLQLKQATALSVGGLHVTAYSHIESLDSVFERSIALSTSSSQVAGSGDGPSASSREVSAPDSSQPSGTTSTGAYRRLVLPPVGSKTWNENEDIVRTVMETWHTTGIMDALAAAVSLKPPVLCYPVGDLDSEAPVGWTSGAAVGAGVEERDGEANPKLRDCILLKPGSTVESVYEALKKGALDHVIVHGDFVRAEGKRLVTATDEATAGEGATIRKRQLGRDEVICEVNCVLRVQTNRKSIWQQAKLLQVHAQSETS